jgi:hypothetical protein
MPGDAEGTRLSRRPSWKPGLPSSFCGYVETHPARPRHPWQATGTAGRLRRRACGSTGHGRREGNRMPVPWRSYGNTSGLP